MSYLGMKILYDILNRMDGVWCERAFMPWVDMLAEMHREGYPLYAHESKTPLAAFDILGFTLQYELSYTNILAMLDLAGIPMRAAARGEKDPLVIAGGPCVCNAEPMAAFFDVMLLGEGERQTPLLVEAVRAAKKEGLPMLASCVVMIPISRRSEKWSRNDLWGQSGSTRGKSSLTICSSRFTRRVLFGLIRCRCNRLIPSFPHRRESKNTAPRRACPRPDRGRGSSPQRKLPTFCTLMPRKNCPTC